MSVLLSLVPRRRRTFATEDAVDPSLHFVVDRRRWHEVFSAEIRGRFALLQDHRQGGKTSAAAAMEGILEARGCWTLRVTLGGLSFVSLDSTWLAIEQLVRAAVTSLVRRLTMSRQDVPPAGLRVAAPEPLFRDAASFQAFWLRTMWGDCAEVALFIDEFDALISAPVAVRVGILAGLRAVRNLNTVPRTIDLHPPLALQTVLGIGVFSIAQLTASDPYVSGVSPFNVAHVYSPPRPSRADVEAMFADFDAENDIHTPPEIINDIVWRSGLHVGLLSFLGQKLAEICLTRSGAGGYLSTDAAAWWSFLGSPGMAMSLQYSPTVIAMLGCLSLSSSSTQIVACARELVRNLLQTPGWGAARLDVTHSASRVAIDTLLSEGVLILSSTVLSYSDEESLWSVDSLDVAAESQLYRVSAPLLTQPLLIAVGSWSGFYMDTLARLRLPLISPNRLNSVQTLVECLPYFSVAGLMHRFAALSDGTPCEYAYHAQLYTILNAHATLDGITVLFEARDPQMSRIRRLDIAVLDHVKAGFELLVNSSLLAEHVAEQAPTYRRQQGLTSVLVVNFCTAQSQMNLTFRVPTAIADEGIELVHVLFNPTASTMTIFTLCSESDGASSFVPSSPIPMYDAGGIDAVAALRHFEEHIFAEAHAAAAQAAAQTIAAQTVSLQCVLCRK